MGMHAGRLAKLRARLPELNVDALLVTQNENRRYLSGFTGSAGALLIVRDRALIAVDSRYWEQAEQQAPGYDVFRIRTRLHDHFGEMLEQAGQPPRLGFESGAVTVATFAQWAEVKIDAEWISTKDAIESLRAVKDADELATIRRAVALTDAGFDYLCGVLKPGMTERDAAWQLEAYLRTHGADALSFEIIVASGPNGAMAHHRAGDRAIQRGEPIVIDFGVVVDGYCSDLTRTVSLGDGDPRYAEVFEAVRRAQQAALGGIHAGMTGVEADALARGSIGAAGYGDFFGHGLGHGVGLAVHEAPSAGRLAAGRLPAGATLTVEPGVYLPGWGGVRIEDLVVVHEHSVEVLSQAHKQSTL